MIFSRLTLRLRFIVLLILNLTTINESYSQYFQGSFGKDKIDIANSILSLNDGGYILVGSTASYNNNNSDIIIMRVNNDNQIIWSKTFGGLKDETAEHIELTESNTIILVGSSNSFNNGSSDILVLNLDLNGNLIWASTYGGFNDDFASCIKEIPNGGYIISGRTQSFGVQGDDGYIIKLDTNGNVIWSKTYGTSSNERFYYIENTFDNGFIITGIQNNSISLKYDQVVIKINSIGEIEFSKNYGDGPGINNDASDCIRQTQDGGYIFSGHYKSYGSGGLDMALTKVDSHGNVNWGIVLGKSGDERAWDLQITSDYNFLLSGYTTSMGNNAEGISVLLDKDGNEKWTKIYGGPKNEEFYEAIINQNEVTFIGYTESFSKGDKDIYIVKTPLEPANENECFSANVNLIKTKFIPDSRDINQTIRNVITQENKLVTSINEILTDNIWDLCPSILPVNSSILTLRSSDEYIDLLWNVSNNKAIDKFIIEGSYSTINFQSIASINENKSKEDEFKYSFLNKNQYKYFRIKILYTNSSYEYTRIVSTEILNKLQIYPIPFDNYILIDNIPSNTIISIIDINGSTIIEQQNHAQSHIKIDTKDLSPSLFLLKIKNSFEERMYSIFKQ